MNVIIMLTFVSICGIAYFTIKSSRDLGIWAGVLNGVLISIANFFYHMIITYLVSLENHKYDETYMDNFITYIFIFKFCNTHLSPVFTVFTSDDPNEL